MWGFERNKHLPGREHLKTDIMSCVMRFVVSTVVEASPILGTKRHNILAYSASILFIFNMSLRSPNFMEVPC